MIMSVSGRMCEQTVGAYFLHYYTSIDDSLTASGLDMTDTQITDNNRGSGSMLFDVSGAFAAASTLDTAASRLHR